MRRLTGVLMAAVLAIPAMAAAPASTTIFKGDKTVIGQPIESPGHPTVTALIITFMPGDKTAVHKHPYPHYGYMLEGTLTITDSENGKTFELKPGDFLVEMMNTAHFGENRGKVPVKMLIVDSVPAGVSSNSVPAEP